MNIKAMMYAGGGLTVANAGDCLVHSAADSHTWLLDAYKHASAPAKKALLDAALASTDHASVIALLPAMRQAGPLVRWWLRDGNGNEFAADSLVATNRVLAFRVFDALPFDGQLLLIKADLFCAASNARLARLRRWLVVNFPTGSLICDGVVTDKGKLFASLENHLGFTPTLDADSGYWQLHRRLASLGSGSLGIWEGAASALATTSKVEPDELEEMSDLLNLHLQTGRVRLRPFVSTVFSRARELGASVPDWQQIVGEQHLGSLARCAVLEFRGTADVELAVRLLRSTASVVPARDQGSFEELFAAELASEPIADRQLQQILTIAFVAGHPSCLAYAMPRLLRQARRDVVLAASREAMMMSASGGRLAMRNLRLVASDVLEDLLWTTPQVPAYGLLGEWVGPAVLVRRVKEELGEDIEDFLSLSASWEGSLQDLVESVKVVRTGR